MLAKTKSPGALTTLAAWRGALVNVCDLGEALRAAIVARDLLGAIGAAATVRAARATLSRVEPPDELVGDGAELAALAEVRALIDRARGTEAVLAKWLERARPGDATLLASPVGVAVLADAILPDVWDFEGDVVVLVGAALAPVVDVLGSLGQRRVVVMDAAGEVDAVPAPAVLVRTHEELVTAVRMMSPCPPARMVVRATLATRPADAQKVSDDVRGALSDLRINRNTVQAFSPTWLAQGMANAAAVARWPSIAAVGDRFRGLPMVIVAPGPSLAKNAHLLRELRGRAIVAAFSHSLKPVLAAGVTPDLVITVDPQDVRYHFTGCDVSNTCLVNAVTSHPSLFELGAARCMTVSANCSLDDWMFEAFGEEAGAPGGGSVATTALSLALRWGCSPVVFVGLDLSFPDGTYYVGTSVDGHARAEIDDRGLMTVAGWSDGFRAMKAGGGPQAPDERSVELPGWHGGTVPSSFMFSMFHRWFVERLAANPQATVFNCTEGGAFIPGMTHRTLADVIAELPRGVDGRALLDQIVRETDCDARTRELTEYFATFVRGLRACRRLAARARVLAYERDGEARLAAVEAQLADAIAPLGFASLLAQRELERAHDVARRDGDADRYRDASVVLFDTLIGVAGRLEPMLRDALDRLRPHPRIRRQHGRAA